ncbi:Peptide ABC transporter ATPase OS=Lysinibacillus sphaericus OX=1421 GN=LS41612_10295 PE=4 SV=1 [Lysinibacillus sphaericus]
MRIFTYKQPVTIESTKVVQIVNEEGNVSSTVQRIYSNGLKKAFDRRWIIDILYNLMSAQWMDNVFSKKRVG